MGVLVKQSHIRAVQSPLPVTSLALLRGENCAARIGAPCPAMVPVHLVTARTLKTACGV